MAPRDTVEPVDDVVEALGQEMDVLAVERGDERRIEAREHLVGEAVGFALDATDGLDEVAGALPIRGEQFPEIAGGIDGTDRDLTEQLEELLVAGQQAHEMTLQKVRAARTRPARGKLHPRTGSVKRPVEGLYFPLPRR